MDNLFRIIHDIVHLRHLAITETVFYSQSDFRIQEEDLHKQSKGTFINNVYNYTKFNKYCSIQYKRQLVRKEKRKGTLINTIKKKEIHKIINIYTKNKNITDKNLGNVCINFDKKRWLQILIN